MTRYVAQAQSSTPTKTKQAKPTPAITLGEMEPLQHCFRRCWDQEEFKKLFAQEPDREAAIRKLMGWALEEEDLYMPRNFLAVATESEVEDLISYVNSDCETASRLRDTTSALLKLWSNTNRNRAVEIINNIIEPAYWKNKDKCYVDNQPSYDMTSTLVRQIQTLAWSSDKSITPRIDDIISKMPQGFESRWCGSLEKFEFENSWVMSNKKSTPKLGCDKIALLNTREYGEHVVYIERIECFRPFELRALMIFNNMSVEEKRTRINYNFFSKRWLENIGSYYSVMFEYSSKQIATQDEENLIKQAIAAIDASICAAKANRNRCGKYLYADRDYLYELVPKYSAGVIYNNTHRKKVFAMLMESQRNMADTRKNGTENLEQCIQHYLDSYKNIYGVDLVVK